MKNILVSLVLLLAATSATAQSKGIFALLQSPTATSADYDNVVTALDRQGLMDSYWSFHALGTGQQGGLFSIAVYPDRAALDARLKAVNPTFAKATVKVPAPEAWEIHNSFFLPKALAKTANAIIVTFDGKGMTAAQYDQIIEGLKKAGKLGVPGQIGHVCYKTAEGLKVVDVWESMQEFEAFGAVLMPIIAAAGVNPGQPSIYKLHALRMPTEADRNRDVMKQFYHTFAVQRSTEACLPLFDPSVKVRFNGMPEMNFDGYKALGDAYLSAVPDLKIEIESIVAEGDKVALLTRATGTQKGALPGLPATGKWFDYRGMEIATLKNGKIVDKHIITDDLTFLQQLGVIPKM